mmetsp:Transcript_46136/g.88036  ORF Transcript_46136/g.88036 Transcript_46136/m.88036 type:complete len:352 (-) Transcript_46136:1050-2105(-)
MARSGGLAAMFAAQNSPQVDKGIPATQVVELDEFDRVTAKALEEVMQTYTDDVMRTLETMCGRLEVMERKVERLGRAVHETQKAEIVDDAETIAKLKLLESQSQQCLAGVQVLREQHETMAMEELKQQVRDRTKAAYSHPVTPPAQVPAPIPVAAPAAPPPAHVPTLAPIPSAPPPSHIPPPEYSAAPAYAPPNFSQGCKPPAHSYAQAPQVHGYGPGPSPPPQYPGPVFRSAPGYSGPMNPVPSYGMPGHVTGTVHRPPTPPAPFMPNPNRTVSSSSSPRSRPSSVRKQSPPPSPRPSSSSSGDGTPQLSTSKVPMDVVIADVAKMGFSKEEVKVVVRKLTENGQVSPFD